MSYDRPAGEIESKLGGAQHVLLLESVGIECYDSESLDTLREALIANVVDGTIDLDALA